VEARSGDILVVEDDPGIREAIAECLAGEGLRVRTAVNGAEGLQMFAEERPALVIVDLVMPVMGGEPFVERLRAEAAPPLPPIVLMTAAAPSTHPLPRVDEVLPKPFAVQELLAMVERHLK
jgi:DNA-binding response OmpR family regulator